MADKTTLAESSQALFCALADYVLLVKDNVEQTFDKDRYGSYEIFKKFWDNLYPNKSIKSIFQSHVEAPKVSLKEIETFLSDNKDWFISSVLIAKKLVKDIDKVILNFKGIKRPKTSEIWFVRGDGPVMTNIEKLFKIANETRKKMNSIPGGKNKEIVFGDINKWSPADIYFASDVARNKIENTLKENSGNNSKGYSFTDLNILISDLIDSGQLLPLSLKKSTKEVNLYKVNFDRPQELKEIKKLAYHGTSAWKPYTVKSTQTRGLEIYVTQDKKTKIPVRHDPSSNAFKAELVISGGEARGGSVSQPESIRDLIAVMDKTFADKYYKIITESSKDFLKRRKDLGVKPTDKKLKDAYDSVREELSALYVTNVNIPPIIEWLNKDQKRADKFVRALYEYVTSRTIDSAKFVIAK
jgi:hypothetical protein